MNTETSPGLASIPDTRRSILQYLKMHGEALTEEIAKRLEISPQGVRQHLLAMERDGLVRHDTRRDGLGRPKFAYVLTDAADLLFPRNYADLTNEILGFVAAEDPKLLERIFAKRAERRLERARERTMGLSFGEKVQIIAKILDEDGYLAEFVAEDDGKFVITEHNCAVLSVALRYGHACSSELAFLQAALPEAEVLRIAHRIAGGHVCAYRVTPRRSDW